MFGLARVGSAARAIVISLTVSAPLSAFCQQANTFIFPTAGIGSSATGTCNVGGPILIYSCTDRSTVPQGVSTVRIESDVTRTGNVRSLAESTATYTRLAGIPPDTGFQRADSRVQSGFLDMLTITSGDRSGRGVLTFDLGFSFDYELAVSTANAVTNTHLLTSLASAQIEARAIVDVAGSQYSRAYNEFLREDFNPLLGTTRRSSSSGAFINGAQVDASALLEPWRETVSFTFGQPFRLSFESRLFAYAQAGGISSANAMIDSMNSLDWLGIASVMQNGISVDYSVVSASGADYRNSLAVSTTPNPVPLPGSLALIAIGCLVAGGVQRRSRLAARRFPAIDGCTGRGCRT